MDVQSEANKRIVREWHELAIDQHKPEEAVAKYLDRTIDSIIPARQMVPNLLLRL